MTIRWQRMKRYALILAIALFVFAYVATAGVALGIHTYFGQKHDALDAVLLILIGLPWSLAGVPFSLVPLVSPALGGIALALGKVIMFVAPALTLRILIRALR